jgi:F-type H+-transporting ATPase subunit a
MPTQLLLTRFLNAHFAAQVDALLALFHVHPTYPEAPFNNAFSMELLVFVFLLAYFILVRVTLSVEKPQPIQHLAEAMNEFVSEQGEGIIGHDYQMFVGYLSVLFLFILLCNLVGLIPGLESPTAEASIPLGLALLTFVYYHYHGVRKNGFGYLKQFIGPVHVSVWMWLLAPLMLVIEIISHLARVLSLTVRLFANMFAGDMVTLAFFSLIPIGIPLIFLGLHVFVSVLQAFVFMALAMSYLSLAVAEEH